jgi:predicted MPP superfamily phosphohydrolase
VKKRGRVFLVVFAGLVLYTGLQVSRALPGAPAWTAWAATVAFFWLILGWMLAGRTAPQLGGAEPGWHSPLAWTASVAFGVWAAFLALSLLADAVGLARWALGLGAPGVGPREARWLAAAAAGAAALGYWQVRRGPFVRRVAVPIAGLPAALQGLRIAQITDLHVGPTIREGYVERVVSAVRALAPDLIAVTGDLADGRVATLSRAVAPLSALTAPLGVFYVTGNHEYYWGAAAWLEKVQELGFIPLVDEGRVVERGGAKILVGGVSDRDSGYFPEGHRSDPRRAALGGEDAALKILLAHRPDSCVEAEPAGFDLQLSGHTHGGQFFPFSFAIRLFHKHYRGLSREGRLWVYVNPGTGYWGPPHRLGVPAEITLLTLTAA